MGNNQLKTMKIYTENGIPSMIGFVSFQGTEEQRIYKKEYMDALLGAYPMIKIEYVEKVRTIEPTNPISALNMQGVLAASKEKKNLNTLIEAVNITDNVFQQKGYGHGKVDVPTYLRTGKLEVFTSADGARDMMSQVDVQALEKEVKASLIEHAIGIFLTPGSVRMLANNIPDNIIQWAKMELTNQNEEFTFNELYQGFLNHQETSLWIYPSIAESGHRYLMAQDKIKKGEISNDILKIIQTLETEKYKILEETNEKIR